MYHFNPTKNKVFFIIKTGTEKFVPDATRSLAPRPDATLVKIGYSPSLLLEKDRPPPSFYPPPPLKCLTIVPLFPTMLQPLAFMTRQQAPLLEREETTGEKKQSTMRPIIPDVFGSFLFLQYRTTHNQTCLLERTYLRFREPVERVHSKHAKNLCFTLPASQTFLLFSFSGTKGLATNEPTCYILRMGNVK
jgi:hypothetical protein